MFLSKRLLTDTLVLPVLLEPPTNISDRTLITEVSGNSREVVTILESGWYYIEVGASTGHRGQTTAGVGGRCSGAVYIYAHSKVLIWSALSHLTGYIAPTGTGGVRTSINGQAGALGGGGACRTNTDSGGGGGGAGGNGGVNHSSDDWGYGGRGGGGAGAIIGIDKKIPNATYWSHGGFFCKSVIAMFLAGGGGGGAADNGIPRSGGGGGGAWGNGGGRANTNTGGGAGPGGIDFGKGANGKGNYKGGGDGAWCIRDFSQNNFVFGTGAQVGTTAVLNKSAIYKINT